MFGQELFYAMHYKITATVSGGGTRPQRVLPQISSKNATNLARVPTNFV